MTDEQLTILIKACLLRPSDDLQRLMLADYCDEHSSYDSTVMRKSGGHWTIRVRGPSTSWPDSVVYDHPQSGYSRIFPASVIQVHVRSNCRCWNCLRVYWRPSTFDDRGGLAWRCTHCRQTRNRPVIEAIKNVGREVLV